MQNIWDSSIEVEESNYYWKDKPIIKFGDKKKNTDYRHIDLFSGCGGFSEGFIQAGFSSDIAIDIHPPSLKTLQFNHPSTTTICGDIKKVSSKLIKSNFTLVKRPTVITAGVPCQGFSLSNRKRHSEDKRNYLFKEFIRITKIINPDAVVLENVSGLASTGNGKFKRAIADSIENLGFEVYFKLLDASDYGVPQKRRRIFFVGIKKNKEWLFPSATHGLGLKKYVSVGDAILGDLPALHSDQEKKAYSSKPNNKYQQYLRKKSNILNNHKSPNHPEETIEKIRSTKPGEPMYQKFKQRIRLNKNNLSPTQICGGIRPQFQFGHPTQARGLTIRERARIQSFPDNFIFHGGIVQGRVQTGNAVPPLLAKEIAIQLINHFNGKKLIGIKADNFQKELF